MPLPWPAPASIKTLCPAIVSSSAPTGSMATRYSSALISLGTPTIIGSTPPHSPGQTLPAPWPGHACPGHGRSPQTFDQTWAHESRERDRDWHAAKLRLTRVFFPIGFVAVVRAGPPDPAVRLTAGLQVTRQRSGTGRFTVAEAGRAIKPLPETASTSPQFTCTERASGRD